MHFLRDIVIYVACHYVSSKIGLSFTKVDCELTKAKFTSRTISEAGDISVTVNFWSDGRARD